MGQQSAVFIDDSPAERGRVKGAFVEMLVPDWPIDPLRYVESLAALKCFDCTSLSREDGLRTQHFVSERKRNNAKKEFPSLAEWLMTLDINVVVQPSDKDLLRATQLLNKTNQFNLSTRRMSEDEFLGWIDERRNLSRVFRVSDRFGDLGITAMASIEKKSEKEAELVDLILSCRAMGRGVEQFLENYIVRMTKELGCESLVARYAKTEKNLPILFFLQKESSAEKMADEITFVWKSSQIIPIPKFMRWREDF